MDIVLSSKKFGPASIRQINYCRLYLDVTLLSDITRPDGRRLDKAAYDGNLTQLHSTNPGLSVNQPKPNNKAWQEWRKFLHLVVHWDAELHLKTPSTEWIVAPLQYTPRWKYLYSRAQDRLFVRTTVGYMVHHRLRYDFDLDPTDFVATVPSDFLPIEARQTDHTWNMSRSYSDHNLPATQAIPTTVMNLVGTLPEWEQPLLQETHFIKTEREVWEVLCSSRCTAASDGSAPKNKGSFGWIISNTHGDRLVRGRGLVFGYAISSYRAEAFGMLSLFRFLLHMTTTHHHGTSHMQPLHLVCDNQGLVRSMDKLSKYGKIFPNTTMEAEWDCLAEILHTSKPN